MLLTMKISSIMIHTFLYYAQLGFLIRTWKSKPRHIAPGLVRVAGRVEKQHHIALGDVCHTLLGFVYVALKISIIIVHSVFGASGT